MLALGTGPVQAEEKEDAEALALAMHSEYSRAHIPGLLRWPYIHLSSCHGDSSLPTCSSFGQLRKGVLSIDQACPVPGDSHHYVQYVQGTALDVNGMWAGKARFVTPGGCGLYLS